MCCHHYFCFAMYSTHEGSAFPVFPEILAPRRRKKRITAINPALLRSIDGCFLQEDHLIFGLVGVSLLCNRFASALNHAAFFLFAAIINFAPSFFKFCTFFFFLP
ncbi:hypothetical protein BT93_K2135 [Corymbia citriodora subsp. variegata]|nr:hypothetical protein BT93_K2135 [Corymbia citriodora subsp. variegata]